MDRVRLALAALLLGVALPAAAQYQHPDAPKTDEEKAFYSAAAKAIFQVMPAEKERFALTLAQRHPPTFPGREPNTLEQVPCEKTASFGMLGYATELGHITAAACNDGAKVRTLSLRARASLASLLKQLGMTEADARKAGWYYSQETLPDGAEFFYYPVLLIGHGIVGPVNAVLFDKKTGKALVVQMEARQMCGEHFIRHFRDSPFCTDRRAALRRIVEGLRTAL